MNYTLDISIKFHSTEQAQAFMDRLDGTNGDVLLAIEEAICKHCRFTDFWEPEMARSDRAWVDIDPHERERFEYAVQEAVDEAAVAEAERQTERLLGHA